MSDEVVEFWVEYETGNEHYRCSVCGNIGPVPQTPEEFMRREAEHLAERHDDVPRCERCGAALDDSADPRSCECDEY